MVTQRNQRGRRGLHDLRGGHLFLPRGDLHVAGNDLTTAEELRMRTKTTIVTTLAIAVLAAACGGGPADGSGAAVVENEPSGVAEPEEDAASEEVSADADEARDTGDGDPDDGAEVDKSSSDDDAELGTRDNPLEVGTRIEMGDWTLAVTEVTLDATDAVMAENDFNDPPVEGRQFVMFNVDATYEGDDSGTAWLDFSWAIVGAAGNTFGTGMDDYCGVIPDPLDDTGETFPGGNVGGNVCVSVDSDQVEGGTIRIEESLSFDDTRAFYALN
jgi:hypothetical protein